MNYDKYIAKTVSEIPPSGIRKFFDIASEMDDVISLGVGEPDFNTPWNICETAIYAIETGKTHYTSNYGTTPLRQEIAAYLNDRFSLQYDINQIVVTVGASEALDIAFRSIINPGDEVLVPAPSYVSYMPGVKLAGGEAVPVLTVAKNAFKYTADMLKSVITPKTKAIILPFPNNPTGAVMTREELLGIVDVIIENDLIVISDEIYSELTYDGKHTSIASLPGMQERTIVINGFSKAFAMTGWRLGFVAAPLALTKAMVKIHQYTILCAPSAAQEAGLEALKSERRNGFKQVKDMVSQYDYRRRYLLEAFNAIGLICFEPKGAFYMFPNIQISGLSSDEFCERLVKEKKVACVPGTAFGEGGEGFIRCSYASSMENLKEAVKRIAEFLKENGWI
ncbi:MAG: aminotransferase class I/II-fold pyridoxal phosphate-dependent enzyme [Eubacteriales bacterium]